MNPSCRFLSTKPATTSPERVFLPNPHLYLHRSTSGFFIDVKSIPSPPKGNVSILRLRSSKLTHPFAALSSFAETEGEEGQKEEIQLNGHHQNAKTKEDNDLNGMATALNISSNTASAISICIAFAALSFPFFMSSLGQNLALKTKLLSYATLLFGFYMAWNIGANDVANAMGTSVGSGALTLRQAVVTAAVLEFSGALLIGTHVTSTMQKGILVANAFQGKDTLLFAGLLSSLAAAGTWLQVKVKLLAIMKFGYFCLDTNIRFYIKFFFKMRNDGGGGEKSQYAIDNSSTTFVVCTLRCLILGLIWTIMSKERHWFWITVVIFFPPD